MWSVYQFYGPFSDKTVHSVNNVKTFAKLTCGKKCEKCLENAQKHDFFGERCFICNGNIFQIGFVKMLILAFVCELFSCWSGYTMYHKFRYPGICLMVQVLKKELYFTNNLVSSPLFVEK